MGSVVLDNSNSFFPNHPEYVFREPRPHNSSPPPRTSRTPSRSEGPMSDSARRASSSSATQATPRDYAPATYARQSTLASHPRNAPHPHSPPVAGRPTSYEDSHRSRTTGGTQASPSPARGEAPSGPRKIKVRDLEHIQSFASQDAYSFSEIRNRSRSRSRGAEDEGPHYEISDMKVEHIIEMVAGLLTKITTTNDRQHEHLHRQPPPADPSSHLSPQTSSVLAFHGKNVPSITILSYLNRINKYCPTSYEVFLSLLVYFDRMTERVNAGPMQSLRQANQHATNLNRSANSSSSSLDSEKMQGLIATTPQGTQQATPPSSGSMDITIQSGFPGTPHSRPNPVDSPPAIPPEPSMADQYNLSHFFVVDSFNIHRLVIAGVTCASKFFSDIFYTNSRYAKVGGLPLAELNHLELQFLLLNDFRLSVPVEEIEAYGTMLVEFYAREVVAQQRAAEQLPPRSLSESSSDSTSTVRAIA